MMQSRSKWKEETRNLKTGDVVLIADPQLIRAHWPVGTITEVLPSQDGRIRVVKVQVKGKVYTRPVSRVILLSEHTDDATHKSDDKVV